MTACSDADHPVGLGIQEALHNAQAARCKPGACESHAQPGPNNIRSTMRQPFATGAFDHLQQSSTWCRLVSCQRQNPPQWLSFRKVHRYSLVPIKDIPGRAWSKQRKERGLGIVKHVNHADETLLAQHSPRTVKVWSDCP